MKTKPSWKFCVLFVILAVFLTGAADRASAADIASFYRGKTMRFVVPFSPGGGYDTYARILASVLEKKLGCDVIVINKPGGGGLVAINNLYDSPRKDGLTISMGPESLPFAQAIGASGVRFDSRKFGWLASIFKDIRFVMVDVDAPYKSIEELKKLERPKAAVTSITSPAGPSLIVALELLNMENAKIVAGYPGSSEVLLAVKRGEADFCVQSKSHLLKKDPFVRPLVLIEEKRDPDFPNIPTASEIVAMTPEKKRIQEIIALGQASGRAVITPPGVSNEKIRFLQKVVFASLKDPEFIKKTQKVGLRLNPLTGEETAVLVEKALKVSPAEVKKLKHILFEKYF
ncbi:Bug family tripartite tricarboxylate transporter substrate binding protein [Thermodesulfobacteriota bacterium]